VHALNFTQKAISHCRRPFYDFAFYVGIFLASYITFLPLILSASARIFSVVSNTVLAAAAEHERHMIGERTRYALAAAKARGIKLGNPEQAKINRAKAAAQAQVLRPHIERCIKAGRTSSNAIAADLNARGIAAPNGGQWFPMQVSSSPPASRPMIDRGVISLGVKVFSPVREDLLRIRFAKFSLRRAECA
jgi:hypothetical protein